MNYTTEMPELLTIREASRMINVHPNTLRNWEREGKIQAVRIGARRDRRYPKNVIWQMCQAPMSDLSLAV